MPRRGGRVRRGKPPGGRHPGPAAPPDRAGEPRYRVRPLHRFGDISDTRTYRERVPPATYDDLADEIRRIAAGEANVLNREPVRLLEPTSGTTGGEKLIPYTAGLRQFQRGVAAWMYDLFRRRPAVRGGRAYWSISPVLGPPRRSPGGLPIGFDGDAAYLGRAERFALRRLLVTPPEVARLPDMEGFRYVTLLSLLAADDLALISVWSPTFLTAVLDPLEAWQDRLCDDLRRGRLSPPTPMAEELARPIRRWLRPDPRRARPAGPRLPLVRAMGRPAPRRLAAPGPHQLLGRRVGGPIPARAARAVPRYRGPTEGSAGHRGLRLLSAPRPPRAALAVRCTSSNSRNAAEAAETGAWPTNWSAAAGIASS